MFRDKTWKQILSLVHTSSVCARHCLIQIKCIHCAYWRKVRLAKIRNGIDPLCDRCHQAPADLIHMFWLSPSITSSIFNCFSSVSKKQIVPCPLVTLFGRSPNATGLPRYTANAFAFLTLLARCCNLLLWKQNFASSFDVWLQDVMNFIHLEKIRSAYTIKGNTGIFQRPGSSTMLQT